MEAGEGVDIFLQEILLAEPGRKKPGDSICLTKDCKNQTLSFVKVALPGNLYCFNLVPYQSTLWEIL